MSHHHVDGHQHVCQVIGDRQGLLDAMASFLAGLETRVGIFVHRYSDEEAWRLLSEAGPAGQLRDAGRLVVAGRKEAFEGGAPRIHHDHVGDTVSNALREAQARGLGLSILADASHAYFGEGRADEWFAFEGWLGARLVHDVALVCLYWEEDLKDPRVLDGMMRTHLARIGSTVPLATSL